MKTYTEAITLLTEGVRKGDIPADTIAEFAWELMVAAIEARPSAPRRRDMPDVYWSPPRNRHGPLPPLLRPTCSPPDPATEESE